MNDERNRLLIFGTGQYFEKRIQCFCDDAIVALLDNNKTRQGQQIFGYSVIAPEEIYTKEYDAVVIMAGANYADEMTAQLKELGVQEEKIFFSDKDYFRKKKSKRNICYGKHPFENRVIAMTPNFVNTGGFRALLYALKAIQELYEGITVISPCDGPAREEIEKTGVDIIITPDISPENTLLWTAIERADRLLLNGLYYGYLIPEIRDFKKQMFWWIHTGYSYYETYRLPEPNMDTGNVKVYGVSDLAAADYRRRNPGHRINIMPLGIPDGFQTSKKESDGKCCFAIIGSVDVEKGIDVFLEAVRLLDIKDREAAKFWIIGSEPDYKYSEKVRLLSEGIEQVRWLGEKTHDEVMQLFSEIDVLVSASLEEMLSIVAIEALMTETICILADSVGVAGYLNHGENGLIFPKGDAYTLAKWMSWCIAHPGERHNIGKSGRKVFETSFSEDAFQKRLQEEF